jgi:hypothetical protein
MNRFLIAGVALAIALAAPVWAGSYYRGLGPAASTPIGGIVRANGTIERGSGFTAELEENGSYRVTFDKGVFPTGCAAVVVNGEAQGPVLSSSVAVNCHNFAPPVVRVHLYDPRDGRMVQAKFQFVAVGV